MQWEVDQEDNHEAPIFIELWISYQLELNVTGIPENSRIVLNRILFIRDQSLNGKLIALDPYILGKQTVHPFWHWKLSPYGFTFLPSVPQQEPMFKDSRLHTSCVQLPLW